MKNSCRLLKNFGMAKTKSKGYAVNLNSSIDSIIRNMNSFKSGKSKIKIEKDEYGINGLGLNLKSGIINYLTRIKKEYSSNVLNFEHEIYEGRKLERHYLDIYFNKEFLTQKFEKMPLFSAEITIEKI